MQRVSELIDPLASLAHGQCRCPRCGAPAAGVRVGGTVIPFMCEACNHQARPVVARAPAAGAVPPAAPSGWGLLPGEEQQTIESYQCYHHAQPGVVALCQQWTPRAERNWLALFGKCGTGKDHLATAMLLRNRVAIRTCYADSAAGVVALFRSKAFDEDDGEMQALRWFERLDVLVLRDVGVKQATNAEFATIVEILDRRYRAGRAVLITSNMTPREFGEAFSERLVDRLWQRGMLYAGKPYVVCDWPSWRRRCAEVAI